MSENNFQKQLLEELVLFFDPVVQGAASPERVYELIESLGWSGNALFGPPPNAVLDAWAAAAAAVVEIERALTPPPESLGDLAKSLGAVGAVAQAIAALPPAFGQNQPAELDSLVGDLFELLALRYLKKRAPVAVDVLRFLTIVRDEERTAVSKDANLARRPVTVERLELDRIPLLLGNPVTTLRDHYFPDGLATDADATLAAKRIFPIVVALLSRTGARAIAGSGGGMPLLDEAEEAARNRTLTAIWELVDDPVLAVELGFSAHIFSAQEQGPGLLLAPFGAGEIEFILGAWRLAVSIAAGAGALSIKSSGIEAGLGDAGLDAALTLSRTTADGSPMRIGSASGTRFEVGMVSFTIEGGFHHPPNGLDPTEQDYGLLLEVGSAALVVSPGDGDGFLQRVLPADGLRTHFDLAVGWANTKGLYFRGSAGLDATLPVHASLFDLITIQSVHLGLHAKGSQIDAAIAMSARVNLGPVTASVDQIGLKATFTFPRNGGNLGPAHVVLGFKPPAGAGLTIDAGAVVGGGYLFFDEINHQYAGVLQLEVQGGIALKAIGLLTTRLPGGVPGFSLLVIISGEFAPIQLGFGFTLNGVGGLFGVNRTMNVDALRTGIKAHTLDSILFPQNPVANAQQIISDLHTVFPPVPERYVFGPMAKLAWGTPTLLTLDLAIVLELPSPVRLAIMGQLRMILPDEKTALVVVRMDVLGIIDFEEGDLAIDATLYDSRVAMFAISGDMAMRLNWGPAPTFLLSAGGLNPRFPAPTQFPTLERLAISLATGDNPRLRLEAYLALTSNTVQFGAHLDLYAEAKTFAGTFSVSGHLGFDALVQFAPFHFIVDLEAGVALKRNGQVLCAIHLNVTLSGPQPWHASGQATFVFIVKLQIPFSVTIGEPAEEEALPIVSPLFELQKALREPRNWTANLPDGHMHVTLREVTATAGILVHPLGSLSVRQTVVPLKVEISRFGNARPDAPGPFTITSVWVGDRERRDAELIELRDYFAPGQFFEMSDDEKLSAPAFQSLMSGVRIDTALIRHGSAVSRDIEYDEVVLDQERAESAERFVFTPDLLVGLTTGGAAASSAMRNTGSARFAGPRQRIALRDVEFAIAGRGDLKAAQGAHVVRPTGPSYMEAQEGRRRTAARGGDVQVIPRHEIVD